MQVSASARRRFGASLVAAATGVALAAVALPASAAPPPHPIPNSTPQLARGAQVAGATPAQTQVDFGLLLGMRDRAGAEALVQQLSDPHSASYAHWLNNAQFRARFAPRASDVTAVRNWLSGHGFQVRKALPSGMYIEASGTAAQVQKVFGTRMVNVDYQGKQLHTNSTALSFPSGTPSAVVSSVAGVIGMNQVATLKKPADTLPGPPAGARYGVQPCSAYYGQKIANNLPSAYGKKQPYAVCGYQPSQYQSAYGETPLLRAGIDGRGMTVAITDAYASPTMLADAQTYSRRHGLPQFRPGQYTEITPPSDGYDLVSECGAQGWYGEETLDVEAVHAMAPGAKVVYVGAKDCSSGLDDAWAETIDNHVADVVSNSWSDNCDVITAACLGDQSYVDFYVQFALEAALTGITVNFSSGDDGDLTSGGSDLAAKTVSFPSDVPWVTGVGGTSVGIGSRGQWLWEHGWQTDYSTLTGNTWTPAPPGDWSSGGGGGTSFLFAQPFYQRGKVPASISEYFGKTPMRAVPDIAMPGDPNTGFLVGETQAFPNGTYYDEYRIGGTSLSSPLLAGMIAVAGQFAHHPIGFANPLYYELLRTPALHDITAPKHPVAQVRTNYVNKLDPSGGYQYLLQTVDVQQTTIHDTRGYDAETGVGTPNGPWFFLGMAVLSYIRR